MMGGKLTVKKINEITIHILCYTSISWMLLNKSFVIRNLKKIRLLITVSIIQMSRMYLL